MSFGIEKTRPLFTVGPGGPSPGPGRFQGLSEYPLGMGRAGLLAAWVAPRPSYLFICLCVKQQIPESLYKVVVGAT